MPQNFFNLFKRRDTVVIVPYGGYANNKRIFAQARILEDQSLEKYRGHTVVGNLLRSFKRFETDERRNVAVMVEWPGGKRELSSDKEGYVILDAPIGSISDDSNRSWITLSYELTAKDQETYRSQVEVLRPNSNAEYGIISDMDETVIHTGLDTFLGWKVIINTLTTPSSSRIPIEGARKFYDRLSKGRSGKAENPFFYLSNSPWNLYDHLLSFLNSNDFPKGPLLLRDFGIEHHKKKTLFEGNKYKRICHILQTYPHLKFVLIGDGIDIDPEIYQNIAMKFPGQIVAIYIRMVSNKKNFERIAKLATKLSGVEIRLVANMEDAVHHAEKTGIIKKEN